MSDRPIDRSTGRRRVVRRRWWAGVALALAGCGPAALAQGPGRPSGRADEAGLPPLPAGVRPDDAPVDGRVVRVQDPAATSTAPAGGPGDVNRPSFESGGGAAPTTSTKQLETKQAPARTFLIRELQLDQSPIKLYGWIQNSYTGNANGRGDGSNFAVFPNRLADQWQGNQYYFVAEAVTRPDDLSYGFRTDFLFGNDWLFTKSYGLFDNAFSAKHDQFTGIDIPQAYLDLHLPVFTRGGIDVRVGRYYNPAGFENVQAIKRPLLSVPYTFNFTPFTYLGALATIHANDQTNVFLGIDNGWDRWFDRRYRQSVLFGYAFTSKDGNTTINTIANIGPDQLPRFPPADSAFIPTGLRVVPSLAGLPNTQYARDPRLYFSTTLTHNWNPRLTEALQSDQILDINNPGFGPGGSRQNTSYYSLAHWLLQSLDRRPIADSKLTGVWRIEAFQDHNGAATGHAGTYYESTLGLITKPKPWLWIRPEARYDWTANGTPFSAGTRRDQATLGFDVIVLF